MPSDPALRPPVVLAKVVSWHPAGSRVDRPEAQGEPAIVALRYCNDDALTKPERLSHDDRVLQDANLSATMSTQAGIRLAVAAFEAHCPEIERALVESDGVRLQAGTVGIFESSSGRKLPRHPHT
jgi:hypothetical protein